jgi:hypothetical protein
MTYVPGIVNATVHAGCKHFVRYPYAGDFKAKSTSGVCLVERSTALRKTENVLQDD